MKKNKNNKEEKKESKFKNIVALIIFILISLLSIYVIFKMLVFPLKYKKEIIIYSESNNVEPHLILAVIKTESKFKEDAVSSKNAKGLMQVMDSTAKDVLKASEINLYDPEVNIEIGTKYLSSLIKKYNGNYYLAICAYNAGPGNVDKWINSKIIDGNLSDHINNDIPFSETKNYLNKVINNYNSYKVLYKDIK